MTKRQGWIVVYIDSSGEWRWRVTAGNGRIVDTPGESFASKANAKRAAIRQHPDLAERVRILEHRFKS